MTYQVCSNDDPRMTCDLFSVLVAVAILEECCMASAVMQWLFYSVEQVVAHWPLVPNFFIITWILNVIRIILLKRFNISKFIHYMYLP